MKKLIVLLMFCTIGFVGCSKDEKPPVDPVVVPTPAPEPAPTKGKIVIVHFNFNSSVLSKEAKKLIDTAVAEKKADTQMTIVGYTDSQGSKKYNQKLSEKRAKSVSNYLTTLKVANSWSGKGEHGLLNKDKTKIEHKANRRVEIGFTVTVK
jgi:outer membrane protein OmpA-like peptidoglycan-associated protein